MALATKKIPLPDALITALDGRTNRWLADKTGIHESEISKIKSGRLNPTQEQIDKINTVLSSDLTINS